MTSLVAQMVKHLSTMWETLVRSLVGTFPGEGNGNPLQYSCLENPMDGGAWCPWGRKELDTTERLHFTCIVGRGCLLWPMYSLGKTISLCPASFCSPRPNLPVTPCVSWLLTFAFQSPIRKRTSFLVVRCRRSYRSLQNNSTSASSALLFGT